MKNSSLKIILLALLCVAVFAAIGLFQLGIPTLIQDSKKVSCAKLPSVEEVKSILEKNGTVVKEIEAMGGGPGNTNVGLSMDTERCPGKADILIFYSTIDQRKEIREKIGNTFFSVPYRMQNV